MDWFNEPLKELFGVPSFWIARFAKTIQFLAGTVIVIEIIGKERIGDLADIVRLRLSKIAEAEPIRAAARDLSNLSKNFLLYINTSDKQKSEEYFEKGSKSKTAIPAAILSFILAAIAIIIFYRWQLAWGWGLIWKLPLTVFASLGLSAFFVHTIFLYIIILIIYVIFRPVEIAFDGFAKFLVKAMAKERVVRRLLILSLGLLVMSFFLDLLAS
jgi:hypothetical protein